MIRPLGGRILVRKHEDDGERITCGGIVLPRDAYFDRVVRGEVVAVGPDVGGIRVGDGVVMSIRVGVDIIEDDVRYMLVRASDVLAILEGEE